MDSILRANKIARFHDDILKLLKQLRQDLGSKDAALEALLEFSEGHANSSVDAALQLLGVADDKRDDIRRRIKQHKNVLTLLGGNVSEIGDEEVDWSLDETATPWTGGAGKIGVEVEAEARAYLETDTDGELFDGLITFDTERDVVLTIGAEGKTRGDVNFSGKLGAVGGKAAFRADGNIEVANHFLHSVDDDALDALIKDLGGFELPGTIGVAGDLRGRDPADGETVAVIPAQYVQLRGEGLVEMGGSLSWSTGSISTGRIVSDRLNLDEVVKIEAGASASVSFSHLLEGSFDILVSRYAKKPGKVLVKLARSKGTESSAGLKIGATLGIEGLDKVGRAVLQHITPRIDALFKKAEVIDDYADVRALIEKQIGKEIDSFVEDNEIFQKVQRYLTDFGSETEITSALKDLASETLLDGVGANLIDDLQTNVNTVAEAVTTLLKQYQGALQKINGVLDEAAQIKLGVTFSRLKERMTRRDVALEFAIDPGQDPGIYREMLRGQFQTALDLALNPSHGTSVELIEGVLREVGQRKLTDQLDITVFTQELMSRTVLKQDWEYEVSLSGSVTIGVKAELENQVRLFGRSRTFRFLTNSRLVSSLQALGTPDAPPAETEVRLEALEHYSKGKKKNINAHERLLRKVELLEDGSIVQDLFEGVGGSKKAGPTDIQVTLGIDMPTLAGVVNRPAEEFVRSYSLALIDLYGWDRMRVQDDQGRPSAIFIARPVAEFFDRNPNLGVDHAIELRDEHGNPHSFAAARVRSMRAIWRMTVAIRKTFAELKELVEFRGDGSPDETKARLVDAQWELVKAAEEATGGIGWFKFNLAFMKAFSDAAGAVDEEVRPFTIVNRKKGDLVFTYE